MTDGAAREAVVDDGTRPGEVDARDRRLAAAVAAFGGRVARRELEEGRTALADDGELSARERAALRAMAARIVAGVLPGPRAIAAADGDADDVAAVVRTLFPVET